jgi:hypothetical protein
MRFSLLNVLTPRSSRYTSNFYFETLDENGYIIDSHSTYQMPPVLASRKTITKKLHLSNAVVGETSKMKFEFQSPVPLKSQDMMVIQFPSTGLAQRLAFTYQFCESSFAISC